MLDNLNILAIVAGGILYMIYGTVYYSILLSDKKAGKNKEFMENQSNGPLKYILSVIIAFISSFMIAILVQSIGSDNWQGGLAVGFIVGALISMVYLKNSLFGLLSRKSLKIAIGDHLIIFTLLGLLHGILM